MSGTEGHGVGYLPDLIRKAQECLRKRQEQYLKQKYRLTCSQYQLLLAAIDGDGIHLGAVADRIGCSRGNLTGLIDRLERDGWLARGRSRTDRRIIHLQLTDQGRKVTEIRDDVTAETCTWLTLPSDEATALSTTLSRLIQGLSGPIGNST